MLQQAAVPFLLTILGIKIAQTTLTPSWGEISYPLILRLLISPAIAAFLSIILGLTGLLQKVFILQAAMPVAINSAVLAIKFDARPNFVANAVLLSTLISIFTLAFVFTLVETLL